MTMVPPWSNPPHLLSPVPPHPPIWSPSSIFFKPSPLCSWSDLFKTQSIVNISLLQTCLWFPIAFIIKPKFLNASFQELRGLPPGDLWPFFPTMLPNISLPPSLFPQMHQTLYPIRPFAYTVPFTCTSLINHSPFRLQLKCHSREAFHDPRHQLCFPRYVLSQFLFLSIYLKYQPPSLKDKKEMGLPYSFP